jgi:hypothetical protein
VKSTISIPVRDLPTAIRNALKMLGYHRRDVSVKSADNYTMKSYGSGTAYTCVVELDFNNRHEIHWGSVGGPNPFTKEQHNPVDEDTTPIALDEDTAVIKGGSYGGHRGGVGSAEISVLSSVADAWASAGAKSAAPGVLVKADAIMETGVPLHEALHAASRQDAALTDLEQLVINAFGGWTSAGRKEYFEDRLPHEIVRRRHSGGMHNLSREEMQQERHLARKEIAAIIDSLVARGLLKRNKAGATQITTAGKNLRKDR